MKKLLLVLAMLSWVCFCKAAKAEDGYLQFTVDPETAKSIRVLSRFLQMETIRLNSAEEEIEKLRSDLKELKREIRGGREATNSTRRRVS